MQADVHSVVIRKRVRKSMGDLTPLAESLRKHGLLNPIVITPQHELIAGHRRLEAARQLGWETIPARIVDHSDQLELIELELDENIHRKNLTTDELADAYVRLDKLRNPSTLRKLWNSIVTFVRKLFRRRPRRSSVGGP
ncbi:MAG: ParB/RepB/Spo0J family partition protein [Spirochaetaceae bacterium]|nr:MAG: ParB/RepB/Spo0J family partition protein [Spirochaetaceae bacterium]